MSTDMSSAPESSDTGPPPSRQVRDHVRKVVHEIQGGYLPGPGRPPTSVSVQKLATLRRALGAAGGADPRSWALVLHGLPERLMGPRHGVMTEPTAAERAVFTALTTYAVHQQSQRSPMHVNGIGLGRATRQLAQQRSRAEMSGVLEDGTVERMHKVSMAQTFELRAYALRALVTLMRSAERPVALDYGRLAEDLYWLQSPRHAHLVHLAWGRDLHARTRQEQDDNDTQNPTGDTP